MPRSWGWKGPGKSEGLEGAGQWRRGSGVSGSEFSEAALTQRNVMAPAGACKSRGQAGGLTQVWGPSCSQWCSE